MGFHEVMLAVLAANGITLLLIYSWLRVNKNENDNPALIMWVLALGLMGLVGLYGGPDDQTARADTTAAASTAPFPSEGR